MTSPLLRRSLALLAATALAAPSAADLLWTTNPNLPTTFTSSFVIGPSVRTPSTDLEVADDFNVLGAVEEVWADGQDCQGCGFGQPVVGAYVRFYDWTPTGPGALQAEYYFADGDPGFDWTTCCGPGFLQFTLPQPFDATGWHFVGVQVDFSDDTGQWHFHRSNVGAPMGLAAYARDRGAGGAWAEYHPTVGWPAVDCSFQLNGTPSGTPGPEILTITSPEITPSARLRIDGSNLGATQDDGEVRVNGVTAPVTQWTDGTIIAYVPEATALGEATVDLVIGGEVVDTHTIDVAPRTVDGRVRWRFALDADYMGHRPGVGPDGSVYVSDVTGRLYKLSPDGGLVWTVDALRGQLGNGGEGPVVVGDDGRVYVTVNPLGPPVELVAYEPDGTLAWVFTENDSIATVVGPGIGPDGNVYITFYGPSGPSLGICSFTPDGTLRWNNPGSPLFYEEGSLGAELAFGASELGGPVDQVSLAVDQNGPGKLYAFDLASGAQNWVVDKGGIEAVFLQAQGEAHTGPDGTVYLTEFTGLGGLGWGLTAFEPDDGARRWRFDPGIASGASAPAIADDGTIYFTYDISRVVAVSPTGSELWTHVDLSGLLGPPTPSPDGSQLLVSGGTFGEPGRFVALDAGGAGELWRVDLPVENGNVVAGSRPAFAPDGRTAYYPSSIGADPPTFQYCYLYALRTGGGDVASYGCGLAPEDSLSVLSGEPVVGTTLTVGVDNPLGTQSAGALPILALSVAPAPGFPCGLPLNGYGMAGPSAAGELLVDLTQLFQLAGGAPWQGTGVPAPFALPVPDDPSLVGLSVYAQGALADGGAALGIALTEGLQFVFGD